MAGISCNDTHSSREPNAGKEAGRGRMRAIEPRVGRVAGMRAGSSGRQTGEPGTRQAVGEIGSPCTYPHLAVGWFIFWAEWRTT